MADSGTAANLAALLRITREITSICEVNDLKQRLVGLAVQVVTASEGAVFLKDDERNGTALRSIADQAFESASSVLAKGNPTYLAVPLSTSTKVHGVLALSGRQFDETQLQLLTAVGS